MILNGFGGAGTRNLRNVQRFFYILLCRKVLKYGQSFRQNVNLKTKALFTTNAGILSNCNESMNLKQTFDFTTLNRNTGHRSGATTSITTFTNYHYYCTTNCCLLLYHKRRRLENKLYSSHLGIYLFWKNWLGHHHNHGLRRLFYRIVVLKRTCNVSVIMDSN